MGWREFCGWLDVMRKQQEGARANPDSWANADGDAHWQEMRQARERRRGR
jgi:hypothetical protein